MSSRSLRMRTTNNSLSTMSSPVTTSSRSASGSTPAPTVNTPASPPSQPVSLPDNSALAHAISRALAESFLRCCLSSRFKWREHTHGRDGWSSLLGFDINAASGILKLRYSRPYPSIFRYAYCALVISTYSSFESPSAVSTLPAMSSANLPVVGGSCGGPTGTESSTKHLWWALVMLQSRISLFVRLQQGFCRLG